jgi:hypothetical protein
MNDAIFTMNISIPITATDRSLAEGFSRQQTTSEKCQQVFENTLAVIVTQRYLQILGVESETENCQSWDAVVRLLENVADLYVPEARGFLECRAVVPGRQKVRIPEEVRQGRLGYVVVRLEEGYRRGAMLGFVGEVTVADGELPLSYLRPLDDLIDRLATPGEALGLWVDLRRWVKKVFEPDWQPVEELLRSASRPVLPMCSGANFRSEAQNKVEAIYRKQAAKQVTGQMATSPLDWSGADLSMTEALVQLLQVTEDDEIRWEATELLAELEPLHPAVAVKSAKDLGLYLAGHRVALLVGMLVKPDDRSLILLRLYPIGKEAFLPAGLKLTGLDESGQTLFEVESRRQDEYIQFKFTADAGDRFLAKVSLGDGVVTESFVA